MSDKQNTQWLEAKQEQFEEYRAEGNQQGMDTVLAELDEEGYVYEADLLYSLIRVHDDPAGDIARENGQAAWDRARI